MSLPAAWIEPFKYSSEGKREISILPFSMALAHQIQRTKEPAHLQACLTSCKLVFMPSFPTDIPSSPLKWWFAGSLWLCPSVSSQGTTGRAEETQNPRIIELKTTLPSCKPTLTS